MTERTLILAFLAGFLPTIAFSLWLVSLLRSRCRTLETERDNWKLACDHLERLCANAGTEPPPPPPAPAQTEPGQTEPPEDIEKELAQLRQENLNLQASLAREKERIGRVVRDLTQIREAWLDSRRLLTGAPDRS